jgi:hypothetical protein
MNSNTLVGAAIGAAAVGLGLLAGWLLFGGDSGRAPVQPASEVRASEMAEAEAAYARGDLAGDLLVPLAEGGDAQAMQRVGYMYAEGLHVEADRDLAIVWLDRAERAGNATAQTLLAELLRARSQEAGGSGPEAVADLERAAGLGDASAQAVLGSFYLVGAEGVTRDQRRAIELLTSAAEAGDVRAQSNLGYIYASGDGAERDDEQARLWYGRAAETGLVRAQVAYARFLEDGRGGEADVEEAARYYINAASAGSQPAQARLGALIVAGSMDGGDPRQAAAYVARLVEMGDLDGVAWLEGRVDDGVGAAAYRLARLFDEGEGVAQNAARALSLYQSAAQAGDPGGQLEMSRRLAAGDGVELDYVEAHKWANLAAAQGLEPALEARASLADLMTADQLAEAQARAALWLESRSDQSE